MLAAPSSEPDDAANARVSQRGGAHPPPSKALLTVRQAAARLGLSKSALDKMRCAGKGPRFIKSTPRAVRYDPADIENWIASQRRFSTKDAAK